MTSAAKSADIFDIGAIDVAEAAGAGVEVQLYHPGTTQDVGIYITVLGKDSAEFLKAQRDQNRRRIAKMQKAGRFQGASMEEIEQDALELLCICTKAWRQDGVKAGHIKFKGEDLPYTRGNALMLYGTAWIREQVDAAINDRALFTKAS